ncbi:MAG: hypothetical protein KC635_14435 [Myxococcales bacterium]|nr:hypothetical protein [Myxococcales bacterium]MCB9731074.1 hypothetical protein [Deltaproteobacteria bacterium]
MRLIAASFAIVLGSLTVEACFPDAPAHEDTSDEIAEDTDVAGVDTGATDTLVNDTSGGDDDSDSATCTQDCRLLDTACSRGTCVGGLCRQVPIEGSCNDGYGCTRDDRCEGGACVGTAVACSDERSCAVATCTEPGGTCEIDSSACDCAVDDDCDDHDVCDGVERCVDGRCVEGERVTCVPSSSACIVTACDPADGRCHDSPRDAGAPCTDDDRCTLGDHCGGGAMAGACVHDDVVSCPAADDCHDVGVCNALSGACSSPLAVDGALCESATGWNAESGAPGTCHDGVCQRLPRVSVGRRHACAVFFDGSIRCWGEGPLGYGNTSRIGDDATHPVAGAGAVPAPPASGVFATDDGTCAINADGLRCWGHSSSCLGYPSCAGSGDSPETVPNLLPAVPLGTFDDGATVSPINGSGTWERVCVVTGRGTVRCFGYEDDEAAWGVGYPGHNAVNSPGSPTLAELGDVLLVPAGQSLHVTRVVVGTNTNCAAFSEGGLRCWGSTTLAGTVSLGDGYIGDDELPSTGPLTQLGSVSPVVSLASGDAHFCVVEENGELLCWGRNDVGQLGIASDVTVKSLPTSSWRGSNFVARQVACGTYSTCALSDLGFVRCWGQNLRGELGIGNRETQGTSVANAGDNIPLVQLGARAVAISGSWNTYCVVLRSGQVACWGANDTGQLGINSTNDFGDDPSELNPIPIDMGPL